MARPIKNNVEDSSFAFIEGTEFKQYHVPLPNWYIVEHEVIIKNDMRLKSAFEKHHQEAIEKMEKSGIKIFSKKPLTHPLTSICPQCNEHGIPKFEKKNADDYRFRNGKYKKETSPNTFGQKIKIQPQKKQSKMYLSYTHDSGKKCWIKQYEELPIPRFVESKHISKKIIPTNPYLYHNIFETLQKKFGIHHS